MIQSLQPVADAIKKEFSDIILQWGPHNLTVTLLTLWDAEQSIKLKWATKALHDIVSMGQLHAECERTSHDANATIVTVSAVFCEKEKEK